MFATPISFQSNRIWIMFQENGICKTSHSVKLDLHVDFGMPPPLNLTSYWFKEIMLTPIEEIAHSFHSEKQMLKLPDFVFGNSSSQVLIILCCIILYWQKCHSRERRKHIWQIGQSLAIFDVYLCIWQKFQHTAGTTTWVIYYAVRQIFIVANGQILKKL